MTVAHSNAAPFNPGEYSELSDAQWEGREYEFLDTTPGYGIQAPRTSKIRIMRVVRNKSGFAVLPKRLVAEKVDNGVAILGQIAGYARLTAAKCFPVDEALPSTGAPDESLFFVTVKGPAKIKLPISTAEFANVAVGDYLVALTAATTGATTAGRATNQDLTGSSAATDYTSIINQARNAVGRALEAATTTGNTSGDILVNVGEW